MDSMTAPVTLLSDRQTEVTHLMTAAVGLVRALGGGWNVSARTTPGELTSAAAREPTMVDLSTSDPGRRRSSLPDLAASNRRALASQEAAISSLATETQTPREVVRRLYDEEMAALQVNAKVGNFIGVIAGRRVKQRLMAEKASSGKISRETGSERTSS